jgi:hypothetical protein
MCAKYRDDNEVDWCTCGLEVATAVILPEKKWLIDPHGYTVINEMGDQVSNDLLADSLKQDWIIEVLEIIARRL